MGSTSVLKKIKGVRIVKPSDHVIQQLRSLISSNEIKPGDVLPSERELANSFGIGRGYIREAIKTLELYGVFKSVPGVGTVVSDLGMHCINEFLNNLVQFGIDDHMELLEVRALVEPFTAYRAAVNATDEELKRIGDICSALSGEVANDTVDPQLECDFHLEIAKASHNRILANTISAILPGLIKLVHELDMVQGGRHISSHDEHVQLFEALSRRDPTAAEKAMRHHMEKIGAHFSVRITHIEVTRMSQRLGVRHNGAIAE